MTSPYPIRYPTLNDAANIPGDMQNLAVDVDAAFLGVHNRFKAQEVNVTIPKGNSQGAAIISFKTPFAVKPVVVVTGSSSSVYFAEITTISTSGFQVYVTHYQGAYAAVDTTITVCYIATVPNNP